MRCPQPPQHDDDVLASVRAEVAEAATTGALASLIASFAADAGISTFDGASVDPARASVGSLAPTLVPTTVGPMAFGPTTSSSTTRSPTSPPAAMPATLPSAPPSSAAPTRRPMVPAPTPAPMARGGLAAPTLAPTSPERVDTFAPTTTGYISRLRAVRREPSDPRRVAVAAARRVFSGHRRTPATNWFITAAAPRALSNLVFVFG